ncbi:amino acid adenylation domain-containing protein [Sphaerisporangium aureirubrum]|uniref:Amino acid adenylation domain-containing protein n=1 Tax=Sphaerisporangium aureirubrum TaxID=1544736 RepID=A0ABW1NIH1_9ACTN
MSENSYPVTPVQQAMSAALERTPAGARGAFWAQGVREFTGGPDEAAFRRAFEIVTGRHAALRAGFSAGGPIQVVEDRVEVPLEMLDWRDLAGGDDGAREERLAELLRADRERGFDPARPPLLRAYLIDLGERSQLVCGVYRGVCDGPSLRVVLDEVALTYAALRRGAISALSPVWPYHDVVAWQVGRNRSESEPFWREYLAGLDAPTSLPADRQAEDHGTRDRRRIELSPRVTAALAELARRADVTLATVAHAAWALLLSRHSGESDVVFGLSLPCRPAGMEPLVGSFVTTAPLRVRVPSDVPFTTWLRQVHEIHKAVRRHGFTPPDDIQAVSEIDPGTPLFGSAVIDVPDDAYGLGVLPYADPEYRPMNVTVSGGRCLAFEVTFSAAAFDAATVEGLLERLAGVLGVVAADGGAAVGSVGLVGAAEVDGVTALGVSGVGVEETSLAAMFARRVAAGRDVLAVRGGGVELTYGELDVRAGGVAALLRGAGARAGVRVGLFVERGVDFVTAILGAAGIGASYVPLDPSWPLSRLRFVIEDSGVDVVVTGAQPLPEGVLPGGARAVDLRDAGTGGSISADAVNAAGDDALYVMYTSGSTGVPKGVEVTHGGVVRLCVDPVLGIGPGDVVAQLAPVSFDASTFEIWGALLNGASLVVATGGRVEGVDVGAFLREHEVSVAHVTAGLFHQVVESAPESFDGLRLLLTGGDALSAGHCERVRRRLPNLRFVACYGPTECTTFSSIFDFGSGFPVGDGVVPIGRPVVSTSLFVVDQWMNLVPAGVPGELLVGGIGVGRGYVGRAGLTAERFIADHLSGRPGERLYRTGDRVRWRADGVLEFLGRTDAQVKIRGFRIEPGEVEAVLAEHPAVSDAVVVARADGPSGKWLVGYVVAEEPGGVEIADLRAYMHGRLPEYMVPSVFMVVEGFALTANDKIDRRALPDPDIRLAVETTYVAPSTDAETTLAGIWSQVLGVDRVGLHDNFFELGGDSILSLQIVARARAAGLQLDVADVFARQSVGELALAVRDAPATVLAEQGTVTGPVPLTPIQHRFAAEELADRDHWNWSGVFELTPGVDAATLARAVDAVVAHHDALRLRFRYDQAAGEWTQENAAGEPAGLFSVTDAAGLDEPRLAELVTGRMTEAQGSLSLADGPLLRAVYFERGDRPGVLGLTAHHLVMDAVSWNVLLDDLGTAYRAIAADGTAEGALPRKTTSFQQWAGRLQEYAASAEALAEADHWLAQVEHEFRPPLDGPGTAAGDDGAVVRAWLDAETTSALLTRAHKAYRTQINDVLLAALLQTVGRWAGTGAVTINLESHGREAVAADIDVSRTVGWFTSIFPVALSAPDLDDPAGVLKAVKEQLRRSPRRGVGFGALRYLGDTADPRVRRLAESAEPYVGFNYLGGLDSSSGGIVARRLPSAWAGPDGQTRAHGLQIEVFQDDDGRLAFEWHYGSGTHRAETVQRVAAEYARALRELVEHCLSPQAGGHTPSDFPLAALEQGALDTLAAAARAAGSELADVYPLTPVQQGILFHALQAPEGSGVYLAQGLYELTGRRVDAVLFQRAWDVVVDRHPALRTAFVWEGVAEPVQVVHEHVIVPFEALDWSALPEDAQRERFDELLAADRARGFDVAVPPLMRVHLIDRGEGRSWLVWTMHHISTDGWSLPILLAEVARVYEGLSEGEHVTLPQVRPYRDFIAWLAERDLGEAERFWRGYLAGFEAPTPLPVDRQVTEHWAQDRRRMELSPQVTAGLTDLARRARVTVGTVVQAAWSLLLSRFGGEPDVVFGVTVSGRPADLAGMESIVGLFINTLPMRVEVPAGVPFVDWLRTLQDNQVAAQRYEYTPLVDIQRSSAVQGGVSLFDSIVVVQMTDGLSVAGGGGAPGMELLDYVELGNYPLNVAVFGGGERLGFEMTFSTGAFDAATVEGLLERLGGVLSTVAADAEAPVGGIGLVGAAELSGVKALGVSGVGVDEVSLAGMFARRVAAGRDVLAVRGGGTDLTYGELDALAGGVARSLRAAGAGARVGVFVERGAEFVAAILGAAGIGASYVPLDPSWPLTRLRFVIEDSGIEVVLTAGQPLPGELAGLAGLRTIDVRDVEPVPEGLGAGAADPGDALYVMYTSGSTGVPKGVEVTHGGVVRLCVDPVLAIGPGDVVAQLAPVTFDASTFEIWGALLNGASLVMATGGRVEGVDVGAFLREHEVSVAHVTAGLFHQVVESAPESFDGLRLLLTGGDALSVAHCERVRGRLPDLRFVACYGPTECTTFSSIFDFGSGHGTGDGVVPIGRPVVSTSLFVVDQWMNLVPAGVPGELLVGGVGVGRGYVGRADLTAERFVADHLSGRPGERLYRTGDRVRWRADGVLEFLGRTDAQVKIRGFRIEPGEVEAVLAEHPGVRDAVVVARADGPSGKRLVGYVTAEEAGGVEIADLRAYMQARLPEYMVPSVFMVVDAFALTANDKIDRRALPEPDVAASSGAEYVPPRTEAEVILAGIWSGVLGVERVGVMDNFFELGGDSILSLQIVARARAAGLQLDVADVFAKQSVRELATAVRDTPVVVLAEQGTVTGPVPLTPVQRWFTRQPIADRDRWNWSGVFELAAPVDAGTLAAAVDALVAHHDALRMRLAYDSARGAWAQENAADEPAELFSVVDAVGMDERRLAELVTERMSLLQRSLSLTDGPLLRMAYFERGDRPGWLGVTVHHLVMDGVSWSILLEDLHRLYESGGDPAALPAKTTSFRQWAEQLREFAVSPEARAETGYWLEQLESPFSVPMDGPGSSGKGDEMVVRTWLDAETTSALLTRVHRAYRTQINDVLLAGLLQALGRWAATGSVTIDLESHGREAVTEGVDLSRTVGWFTSVFPVALSAPDLDDPAGVLKAVKEQLRRSPRRGVGFGALRYLGDARRLGELPEPYIGFNYIGAADAAAPGGLVGRRLPASLCGSDGQTRAHGLQIEVYQDGDGRMAVEWQFSAGLHRPGTIERVAQGYIDALRELVGHCLSPRAGGHTPSDFPLAALEQGTLDTLAAAAREAGAELADVYPLSPVQQGILFHALQAPSGSGVYLAQGLYEYTGALDADAFRQAWDAVVARHPALRTGLLWEGVAEPVQVVHDRAAVPFEALDWSHEGDEAAQRVRLRELLEADRDRGFDLARPPLMRVTLVGRGGDRHWLVLTFHHICTDGWSLPILVDEATHIYEAARRGARAELPAVRPYRDFIAWLDGRSGSDEEFWREYLAGFEAPTPLPVDRQVTDHWAQDRRRIELPAEATAGLVELARRARVTLGTVVQAAWALLLSRSSGERDVMFGLTVSGRPAELAGMESIVGLFINTLPMRVDVPADVPFAEWLPRLQDNQVAVQRYEYTPLVDIQRYSSVPRGSALFDSIMVFGNYPQNALAEHGVFTYADSFEQGNSPLMLAVNLRDSLEVEVEYSTAAFDELSVDRLLDRFARVLVAVAADAGLLVRDVPVTLPGERELLAGPWARSAPVPDDALVPAHELVADWARSSPGETAVVCGDDRLTFAELDARAESLAGWLRSSGVGPEVAVGVVLGRGVDLVVAFMAVLKCGGVYVPLNVGQPVERLGFMLEDCGASVLVSSTDLAGDLPPFAGPVLMADRFEPAASGGVLEGRVVGKDVPLDGLAYMAFTSGSTGRPKGVGVTHRGLAGYVAGWGDVFGRLGGPGAMLSMAGAGFDVSVGDIVRALCFGRAVVFTPQSDFVSVAELHQVLDEHEIEIAEIVPGTLLRELAGYCREAGGLEKLRLVISGTDIWRHEALVAAVADVAPAAIPANVYGVTEAAIDSLLMPLTPGGLPAAEPAPGGFPAVPVDGAGLMVPVGRPLAGVRVYVVDQWLNLVPVGVAGELLVGGVGVARGYVGRAGLTSERFIADHLSGLPGERLYRTGDRVRWRADGALEFLGRTDEQVKIRGFRIEPGEIENVLAEHAAVQDAVVVARDDGPNGKRLIGYVVAEPGAVVEVADLRVFLRARLPEYMVPAVLMVVEAFALTANGKVDRRALPEPELGTTIGATYVPPSTEAEMVLAEIWSQVLGVERVGLQDNFFELGGDSILSLQIVARARAAGLQLDVADVFARQSVGELAMAVRDASAAVLAEQGLVTGPVPLTPIQHWFTRQDIADRDHWNWSGVLELSAGADLKVLGQAVDTLIAHHDALRTRFAHDAGRGGWVQENAAEETAEVFSVIDAVGLSRPRLAELVTERMTVLQRSLSLADGPLLRVAYFERGDEPGWLGVTVHHLVMDGVSWTILLDDLGQAYQAILAKGTAKGALPAKTTSVKQWAEQLRSFAGTAEVRAELGYWLEQLDSGFRVPVDGTGDNSEASRRTVRVTLDAEATSALLTRAHKAYRTRSNDLLLAALLRALGRWAGTGAVTVDLESHGREPVNDQVDLSRTVGWFTSIYPVTLSSTDLDDPAGVVKSVKEQLRRTPRRGVGYGALRHLTDDSADPRLDRLRGLPEPGILFNYMGGADAGGTGTGLVARALPVELCGPTEGADATRSHVLQIEAAQGADGQMVFDWYYSAGLHRAETVERIANDYVRELKELVEHCLDPQAGGFTPSDFPLANLNDATLAAIMKQMGGGKG